MARHLKIRAAQQALTAALVQLAAEGQRPRCGEYGGADLWLSEDPDDRALAARWCRGCLVLDACHNAAEEGAEQFGVWAGIDRTATTQPQRKAA